MKLLCKKNRENYFISYLNKHFHLTTKLDIWFCWFLENVLNALCNNTVSNNSGHWLHVFLLLFFFFKAQHKHYLLLWFNSFEMCHLANTSKLNFCNNKEQCQTNNSDLRYFLSFSDNFYDKLYDMPGTKIRIGITTSVRTGQTDQGHRWIYSARPPFSSFVVQKHNSPL